MMIKRSPVLLLLLLPLVTATAQQPLLNRITTAERSDGKGYVVRFHMTKQPDSSKTFQPTVDLIQMTIYGEEIDTSKIDYTPSNEIYDEISFHRIPGGVGIDIYLKEGEYYRADLYPDRQSNDLLLGLTESTREDISFLTEGIDPVIWTTFTVPEESLLVSNRSTPTDTSFESESYRQVKDKLKFDVVVIDPGHGGHDVGTIGYKNTYEKDVVLDIAKKVGQYIEQSEEMKEVKVVYTRDDDSFVPLEERGSIANRAEGDLFVSIHANSFKQNRNVRGTEVYFLGLHRSKDAFEVMKKENSVIRFEQGTNKSEQLTEEEILIYELANSGNIATSQEIAGMIEYQLDERAKRHSRGVKQAGFIVLYHASMPALLVETGFITNPSEQRYLTSNRGQTYIASAIFRAIRNYKLSLENNKKFNTN